MILTDFDEHADPQLLENLVNKLGQETFKPGLERFRSSFDEQQFTILNNFKIITVAGTNGKGQTCFNVASYLEQLEISYCLWTSPHVLSLRERFRTNGKHIELKDLERILRKCFKLKKNKMDLSFYEFVFYAFCHWVLEVKPEVLILEVGLGGRLDAVNIFDADITALTSISRDHTEFLGKQYRQIIREKLGVLRPNSYHISALNLDYLKSIEKSICAALNCTLEDLTRHRKFRSYQEQNHALAKSITKQICEQRNRQFCPDKMQLMPSMGRDQLMTIKDRTFIFKGSHNIDGIRQFVDQDQGKLGDYDYILAAFSAREVVDLRVMVAILTGLGLNQLAFTNFNHQRAWRPELIGQIPMRRDWKNWVISEETANKKILFVGSYFFLGEVQAYLYRHL